jgi:FF domain
MVQVMLKERGVPPFAKWEKELPKIIFDPRFKVCLMPTDYEI